MVYNRLDGGTADDVRVCAAGDKDVSHKVGGGRKCGHAGSVQHRRISLVFIRRSSCGYYHHYCKSRDICDGDYRNGVVFLLQ